MLLHHFIYVRLVRIFLLFLFLNWISKLLCGFLLDWLDVWFCIDICVEWSCILESIKVLFSDWWMNMTKYVLWRSGSECVLEKLFWRCYRHLESLVQRVSQRSYINMVRSFEGLVKIYYNFFLRYKLLLLLNWLSL